MKQFRFSAVISRETEINRANAVSAMCDECVKLDQKIEHYKGMIARIPDPLTTERVGKLIEDLQAQKAALHPEKDGTAGRS
jgi:hypothetical protein